MRTSIVGTAFVFICLALAAGCGGGSSTPSSSPTATPTSSPTTVPTGPPATSAPISTATASSASVANGGYAAYLNFPAATSGTATMALYASTSVGSNPAGITPFTGGTTLLYVTFQPSATVTLPSYPQFQLQIPAAQAPQGYNFWGAIYTNDPAFPAGYNAWSAQFLGPASASGQTLYFPVPPTSLTFTANDYYVFALYDVPA
jgi:hypothetical protein